MAKSVIMLAVLKEKIDAIEKDCLKFDEKENLEAGMRIRGKLKKLKRMINKMIADTLETSKEIREKRGKKPHSYYYSKYKKDGRMDKYRETQNAKKNPTEKLSNTQGL